MGMRVIAIDGGDAKRDLCVKQLGAEHFIDFSTTKDIQAEVMKITQYGAHGKRTPFAGDFATDFCA